MLSEKKKTALQKYNDKLKEHTIYHFDCGCCLKFDETTTALTGRNRRCPKHLKAKLIKRVRICLGCETEFELTKESRSGYCRKCQLKNNVRTMNNIKRREEWGGELQERKWDCKHYDYCISQNKGLKVFNCPPNCKRYIKHGLDILEYAVARDSMTQTGRVSTGRSYRR